VNNCQIQKNPAPVSKAITHSLKNMKVKKLKENHHPQPTKEATE
jgi:hypothetical protein